jgi:hypothetical protein
MSQYQHIVQQAYLRRWMHTGNLFLFDKHSRKLIKKTTARKVFGEFDWQSDQMESAFSNVEKTIGHTDMHGEFKDFHKQKLFTDWLALHLVRNRTNLSGIIGKDYRAMVECLSQKLMTYHAFWQDFTEDAIITSDTPVILISHPNGDFFIAPLSPRRCVYLMYANALPLDQGTPCFKSNTINRFMINTSNSHCVSFDNSLHLP